STCSTRRTPTRRASASERSRMPPTRHTRRPDVTQLLNFAHGDLYMLGAFAGFAMLSVSAGALGGGLVALVAIMIVAMIASGTLGMVMERVAYRPLRSASRLSVLITAVGASFALEYGIAVAFGPTPEVYQIEVRGGTLNIAGAQITQAQLAMTAIAVVLMIALDTLVRATRRRCDSEHRPRHQGTGSRLRQGGSPQGARPHRPRERDRRPPGQQRRGEVHDRLGDLRPREAPGRHRLGV